MRIVFFSFTRSGALLSHKLALSLKAGKVCLYAPEKAAEAAVKELESQSGSEGILFYRFDTNLSKIVAAEFNKADALIFIGAAGIAIRSIAPYIKDKFKDPAVLCMDEAGEFVIPLLSGHIGGANELAEKIAEINGSLKVITTATDVRKLWAVDVFAKKNQLAISDRKAARLISASLLEDKNIGFFSDYQIKGRLPKQLLDSKEGEYNVFITNKLEINKTVKNPALRLIPKNICLGVGCRRDTGFHQLLRTLKISLKNHNIDIKSISHIASIDIKKDEACIIKLANALNAELCFFNAAELARAEGKFNDSEFVSRITGVGNVCERACRLVYKEPLFKKEVHSGMAFAASIDLAREYEL